MVVPDVDLTKLESLFSQLERHNVRYELGAKATTLDCDPCQIEALDCSGFVRYALHKATARALTLPDGSQNQRVWCELRAAAGQLQRVERYADCACLSTDPKLFICFIKPHTNGCGKVGHVWLVSHYDDGNGGTLAGTLESHGGAGINSRAWNSRTLVHEFHSAYSLQVK